jgi:hypothetical protein
MNIKKMFLILFVIVISGNFISCFLSPSGFPIVYDGPIYDEKADDNNGSMLVQYGDYIYKIGGYDNNGIVTDSVFKSKIVVDNGDVQIGDWTDDLPLPSPRVNGAAFAAGNYLYVIGGEDKNGPVSTVFVTQIASDETGTLGTAGGAKYWTSQVVKLPEPRSHMSLAYADGRVFLIGGKNGGEVFDTILQARLQIGMSGYIGHWYTSPINLYLLQIRVPMSIIS